MTDQTEPTRVSGERVEHSGGGVISAQSRVSNMLALGLMLVLGLGCLTWYYVGALNRHEHDQAVARSVVAQRAQAEMPLPALGPVGPPSDAHFVDPLEPVVSAPAPPVQAPESFPTLAEIPLAPTMAVGASAVPAKTPAQIALERRLSGGVYSTQRPVSGMPAPFAVPPSGTEESADAGSLPALLRPRTVSAARAAVLPVQRLLLPKGAFIDCTLETAIDSTLPGMTTCVMATDTFGVDGAVVLLERGTKLIGETRGQIQQGAARIFVLWTEARTPRGVVVPLDSPGADELGRSGLPGEVNHHFWQRFGAALLVSVVDGAIQAATTTPRDGGTVVVNPSAQGVMTEILKSTINIPPTIVKKNGDRIQVLVARDIDFRSVYELRTAGR